MQKTKTQTLVDAIDGFSEWTGRIVSWLTLFMVLVTFVIVVLRYAFDLGWIWMQESVTWMHALVLLLGAAYTLKHDEHVRVDVLYQRMTPKKKALINILGTVFLLFPATLFIFFSSLEFVTESWKISERSREAGGLPAIYFLKTAIPLAAAMVFLQGVAELLRALLFLKRKDPS